MEAITKVKGKALPLRYNDVDTDQIAPSDTLKFSERINLSDYLFQDWREEPGFIMNQRQFENATILLSGENFGCGSSREHAPWALLDYGFKAVIAASFGDIFRTNCYKVGLLAIQLPMESIDGFMRIVEENPETQIEVSLEECTVTCEGFRAEFLIDPIVRQRLLKGLNDIEVTLLNDDAISYYESARSFLLPKVRFDTM